MHATGITTLAQVFLKFTTNHHPHVSKQASSIKLLIVFNALYMKVFIISLLDAYHIRTKFITKVNYHAVLKDSQNNISEAWETSNFYKIKPPPYSKRYKWSTRAKTIKLKRYKWSTYSILANPNQVGFSQNLCTASKTK